MIGKVVSDELPCMPMVGPIEACLLAKQLEVSTSAIFNP